MRALLSLGLVVIVGIFVWGFHLGPFAPRDPYDAEVGRVMSRLLADPEVRPALEARIGAACHWPLFLVGLLCPRAAGDVAFELARKGVPRLGREAQVERALLVNEIFASLDEPACGALGRAQGIRGNVKQVVGRLSPAVLARLMDLASAVIVAEIRGTPAATLNPREIRAAEADFNSGLDGPTRSRLMALTILPLARSNASDADVCWVVRTVYARVAAMAEPHRSAMALHLVE